ncbi:MAG: hypothetical protein IJ123_01410 [Blautia sp.]|nr:hypothetical protein [Blautia sp.]
MEIIQIKCPHCNADLTIKDDRKTIYCEYCGSQLLIEDESKAATVVNIVRDEARLQEILLKEKQWTKREEDKKLKPIDIISIVGSIFCFVFIFVNLFTIDDFASSEKSEFLYYFFIALEVIGLIAMIVFIILAFHGYHRRHQYDNKNDKNSPKCPSCGSTSIDYGSRGLSITYGFIGRRDVLCRCKRCGRRWNLP